MQVSFEPENLEELENVLSDLWTQNVPDFQLNSGNNVPKLSLAVHCSMSGIVSSNSPETDILERQLAAHAASLHKVIMDIWPEIR